MGNQITLSGEFNRPIETKSQLSTTNSVHIYQTSENKSTNHIDQKIENRSSHFIDQKIENKSSHHIEQKIENKSLLDQSLEHIFTFNNVTAKQMIIIQCSCFILKFSADEYSIICDIDRSDKTPNRKGNLIIESMNRRYTITDVSCIETWCQHIYREISRQREEDIILVSLDDIVLEDSDNVLFTDDFAGKVLVDRI